MIDYEKIITSIKDLYNSGKTQQEIANLAGFKSNTKISELISGSLAPKNLTVESLCKLIKVNGDSFMNYKKINIAIKNLHDSGKTQQELAKEAGYTTHKRICELISGALDPKNMTVESLCKLIKIIPESSLVIDNEIISQTNTKKLEKKAKELTKNTVIGNGKIINNSQIINGCNFEFEELEKEILELKDIDLKTVFQIIKLIKKHKKQ